MQQLRCDNAVAQVQGRRESAAVAADEAHEGEEACMLIGILRGRQTGLLERVRERAIVEWERGAVGFFGQVIMKLRRWGRYMLVHSRKKEKKNSTGPERHLFWACSSLLCKVFTIHVILNDHMIVWIYSSIHVI